MSNRKRSTVRPMVVGALIFASGFMLGAGMTPVDYMKTVTKGKKK